MSSARTSLGELVRLSINAISPSPSVCLSWGAGSTSHAIDLPLRTPFLAERASSSGHDVCLSTILALARELGNPRPCVSGFDSRKYTRYDELTYILL